MNFYSGLRYFFVSWDRVLMSYSIHHRWYCWSALEEGQQLVQLQFQQLRQGQGVLVVFFLVLQWQMSSWWSSSSSHKTWRCILEHSRIRPTRYPRHSLYSDLETQFLLWYYFTFAALHLFCSFNDIDEGSWLDILWLTFLTWYLISPDTMRTILMTKSLLWTHLWLRK